MRKNWMMKATILGLSILFIGASIAPGILAESEKQNDIMIQTEIDSTISLELDSQQILQCDEEIQQSNDQGIFERDDSFTGVFLTISFGIGQHSAPFRFIPIYLRPRPFICMFANIDYTFGWTRVRPIGTGLVYNEFGPHNIGFSGMAIIMIRAVRNNEPLLINRYIFIGISLLPPVFK